MAAFIKTMRNSKIPSTATPSGSSAAENNMLSTKVTDTPNGCLQTEGSRLIELTSQIVAGSDKLQSHIQENRLPQPGFDVHCPDDFPRLPPEIQQSRQEIMYACKELMDLVRGPKECVRWGVWSVCIESNVSSSQFSC